MNNQKLNGIASLGRGEDNYLAHVARGEMVVPPLGISEETRNRLKAEMKQIGLNPNEYTVGEGMSINPITGMPEFGFFKKIGKAITKITDKIAPIVAAVDPVGPYGQAARVYMGVDKTLEQKKLQKRAQQQADSNTYAGGGIEPQFGLPGFNPNITGLGQSTQFLPDYTNERGFLSNISDVFGIFSDDDKKEKSGILESIFGSGGALQGINPMTAGLGGLYGLATKKAAEREQYGVQDVRDAFRPDLRQNNTSYGVGGFDVGYAEGGEVLDMRNGGESIGPGTGTSDDIPAMLSDGEFVMTAAANKGIGGFKLTKSKDSIELIPTSKPSRKVGASNMMDLMKTFEQYNQEYSV
tara:strand:+ start:2113 stop:3171 length:1059 start_codon:yes stop_codon:yes gene_type:complete